MTYQSWDAVKCLIFEALKPLPENQLPTYLHVMKAFLYERPILKLERKNAKLPLREIAAEVAQKVEAIWRKGNIPTVSHTRIVQLLFLTCHIMQYPHHAIIVMQLIVQLSSSDLQSRYTEARKAATSAVKKSKEKSWEEFGRRLDSNYFSANKVFWQTIRRLRGKRSSITYSIKDSDGNILTDENEILSRWREYFEDLLNPVKASTRDTHEVTHLGEDEVFTAAEVATAIKGIKSGKAAGEDEIRPEMLKALTGEGILWLTRVCQVAWKLGKTPRDWQTGVIIPIFKKGDRKQCTNYRGISLLSLPGKVYAKALKGNAEK